MQLALDALVDVARDLATAQCAELYAALGDRSPQRHAAAQRDVDQIETAIEALHAALAQQDEPCDMGAICIGCTPRVCGACPGAVQQPAPVAQTLTDEQLEAIISDFFCDLMSLRQRRVQAKFARAIERAHKIGSPL